MSRKWNGTIEPGDFERVAPEDAAAAAPYERSLRKNILRELCRKKTAVLCVAFLVIVVAGAVLAPLTRYDPDAIDAAAKLAGVSSEHWLGTDEYGRDYFTRVLYGSQVSLLIGVCSMLIAVLAGTLIGTLSGYLGGKTDTVIMRLTDVFLSLPAYLVALVLKMLMDPTLFTLVLILSLFAWPSVARVTRAKAMSLKQRDFVTAAKNLGASDWTVIRRHIIPNMIDQITVAATLSIAGAILAESFLSYLGLGVQLPRASWGSMLQSAQTYMVRQPLLAVVPGLLILLTAMSFNVLGDVLQKALGPGRAE